MLLDSSGQTTVEYVVMLAMTVFFALIVIRGLIVPAYQKLAQTITQQITTQFVQANLHQYRVPR